MMTTGSRATAVTVSILIASLICPWTSAEQIDCSAPCDKDDGICTYTVKVDLFAGELGYYKFEECGDIVNPTIAMEVGKIYRFAQADRSNYYHPLGFSYYPDGTHAGVDELEPAIVPPGSNSTCSDFHKCPAPMYYQDGVYLGTMYNNLPIIGDEITNPSAAVRHGGMEGNMYGLNQYASKFFHPIGGWLSYGQFDILLYFDDDQINQDIFYFCHGHRYMTGRIKLVDSNGEPLVSDFAPPLGYEYDQVSEFDQKCGTFNTSNYQLPNDQCPDRFVCDIAEDSTSVASRNNGGGLEQFAECLDAMNCAMMVGMTTDASTSEIGLFIHQMIPHHQNAVNMAKALLKTSGLKCEDPLANPDDPNCIMDNMVRDIINNQNKQIQVMRKVLNMLDEPAYADCVVPIFGEEEPKEATDGDKEENDLEEEDSSTVSYGTGVIFMLLSFVWMNVA